MPSNANAIAGEMPIRPFTSRESVLRATPSRLAASVSVHSEATIASRMLSPGCVGLYMAILLLLLMVVDEVHVYDLAVREAKDDPPVA